MRENDATMPRMEPEDPDLERLERIYVRTFFTTLLLVLDFSVISKPNEESLEFRTISVRKPIKEFEDRREAILQPEAFNHES